MCMCVGEGERKREERSKQQREKDRDGGGDLSQELEAYPGSTVGSSLDIAVSKRRIRKQRRRRTRTEKSAVTCDIRGPVNKSSQHWFNKGNNREPFTCGNNVESI